MRALLNFMQGDGWFLHQGLPDLAQEVAVGRRNTIRFKMDLVMNLRPALTLILGKEWLIDDGG
jgi:hypothetical protein